MRIQKILILINNADWMVKIFIVDILILILLVLAMVYVLKKEYKYRKEFYERNKDVKNVKFL